MKINRALATATALSLLMGAAHAQNNAGITQAGDINTADVDQAGDGTATDNTATDINQIGDRNVLILYQTSDGNTVGHVDQNSQETSTANTTNSLTILQQRLAAGDSGNLIGTVTQTNPSTAPGSTDLNAVSLFQSGSSNTIDEVTQQGSGNTARLTQSGNGNGVTDFEPLSFSGFVADVTGVIDILLNSVGSSYPGVLQSTATQKGDDNSINYSVIGDDNGFGLLQDGDGNTIHALGSSGNGNRLAIVQFRDGNTVVVTQRGGDDTGIFQQGSSNYANVFSNGLNHYGIGQYGDDNQAIVGGLSTGNIGAIIQAFGSRNEARLMLDGSGNNIVAIVQGGDDNNRATIDVKAGGENHLGALQIGEGNVSAITLNAGIDNFAVTLQGGAGNEASVTIDGSNNNRPLFASFAGAAAATAANGLTLHDLVPSDIQTLIDAAGLDPVFAVDMMRPGVMTQVGNHNDLEVEVSGSDNLFATLQFGSHNAVSHTVGFGFANQAAIVQIGSGNVSVTTQNGSHNNIGVSQ